MLKGKILYQKETHFGPVIVAENRTNRWMMFDDVFIQTIINKKKPMRPKLLYIPSMALVLEKTHAPILLLGAGAGAMLHYLAAFFPTHPIEAIEINPDIIDIAHSYFDITHPIIEASGVDYLKKCLPSTHIFVDMFTGSAMPPDITCRSFYENCQQKALSTLSLNLISNDRHQTLEIIQLIRNIFENRTLCLTVKGLANIVLHAFNDKQYLHTIDRLTQQKHIKPPIWDPLYGITSESI